MMRIFAFLMLLAAFSLPAHAGETVTYKDGDTVLEGYFARTDAPAPAPVILVIHQWKGLTDYEKMRADMLAAKGYNAFAIDMYGQGVRPVTNEEAGALATKYKNDPDLSRRRIAAALDLVKSMSSAGPEIAVMGYCFGGTMALEAARGGMDFDAFVSFHGGLSTPDPAQAGVIKAPLLVHHGADDPFVPPADVAAFEREMMDAGTQMTLYAYVGAVHAFTQKEAGNDPTKGAAYNAEADIMSWERTMAFLDNILKKRAESSAPAPASVP
ncbi:MAG: dienelactone hydrolase family protein [Proteobacteria bacterium]|nr:dienelactone hydrolase family protein [Pseudomonadota bacterium]